MFNHSIMASLNPPSHGRNFHRIIHVAKWWWTNRLTNKQPNTLSLLCTRAWGSQSTSEHCQPETKSKTYKIYVNQGTKSEASLEVDVGPALTPEELQIAASKEDHLFVMEFPNERNSYCYLDTYRQYKRYQALPEDKNLSLLMRIHFIDLQDGYRLSTLVIPAAFLSLTETYVAGRYRKLQYMNFFEESSIPIFQVHDQGDLGTGTLLSFSTKDRNGTPWYLYPYNIPSQGPMVVSTSNRQMSFNYNVFQVTSDLPEAIVSWMKKK